MRLLSPLVSRAPFCFWVDKDHFFIGPAKYSAGLPVELNGEAQLQFNGSQTDLRDKMLRDDSRKPWHERRADALRLDKIEQMDKVVRIFESFADADAATDQARLNMTPEERVEIFLALQQRRVPDAAERRLAPVCRVLELERS